jgi:hypothetical protein
MKSAKAKIEMLNKTRAHKKYRAEAIFAGGSITDRAPIKMEEER